MYGLRLFLFAILVLVGSGGAQAAIIYHNGNPTTSNGYSIRGGNEVRDDFTLAAGGTVRSVGFYFQNYNGITGWDQNITYNIWNSARTSVLASGAGQDLTANESAFPWCCRGGNAWLVEFNLASAFNAVAGTQYWLGLTGAGGTASSAWWVTAGLGNGQRNGSTTPYDFSFYLSDTLLSGTGGVGVPAPGALALLGIGLLCLRLRRRTA